MSILLPSGLHAAGLTNGAYWSRRDPPTILLCIHITGNASLPKAAAERSYANRPGSTGPSAHDYIDRDGTGIEAIDPARRCAWSNGIVAKPNLAIPTVRAAIEGGVNPNRIVYREIECVGYPGKAPVTDAQLATVAALVRADAAVTGLPINRSTVTTHTDFDGVNRTNCAFSPATREARLARIIALASAQDDGRWSIRIAPHALVKSAAIASGGCISGWTATTWGAKASSAPCEAPVSRPGCSSGRATVALVTAGLYAGKWIRIGNGVTVTQKGA